MKRLAVMTMAGALLASAGVADAKTLNFNRALTRVTGHTPI